nr:MAG: hypothetical protein TU36_04455 [Vulcanisaeta sp. AZ3]
MGIEEVTVDLRGMGCPYGSTLALQHFKEAMIGTIITFILDDYECYLTLKRLFPLLGQRIISSIEQGKIYRLSILKVRSF